MKKLLLILSILLCFKVEAQNKNYISVGTGAFFNSPIKDWKQLLGASVEYGRYFESGISVGINGGYWSLLKDYQYNGVKITQYIYKLPIIYHNLPPPPPPPPPPPSPLSLSLSLSTHSLLLFTHANTPMSTH
jgi:hypothetical protein